METETFVGSIILYCLSYNTLVRNLRRKRRNQKMQAIKDKIQDMRDMQQAKAEAKAEEQAEKELAKARLDVAHEIRKAKEAEAEKDLHVIKAAERVDREIAKHQELGGEAPIVGIANERQGNLPLSSGGSPNLGAMGTPDSNSTSGIYTPGNTSNMTYTPGTRNPKLFSD